MSARNKKSKTGSASKGRKRPAAEALADDSDRDDFFDNAEEPDAASSEEEQEVAETPAEKRLRIGRRSWGHARSVQLVARCVSHNCACMHCGHTVPLCASDA